MSLVNIIAKIAEKMPYTVNRARFFKRFATWPNFKKSIDRQESLAHYIVRHGIENKDNPRWILLSDKFACREEVDRILGKGHLIPLLGHWENPEDIDFDNLPNSFILKTNNGCGTNIFVHDKSAVDKKEIIRRLRKSLEFPYSQLTGQPHYSRIRPYVIAEEILKQDGGRKSLTDYKIHCVNGKPVTIYQFLDRDENEHFSFKMCGYTPQWQSLYPNKTPDEVKNDPVAPGRPEMLDELLEAAAKLSAGEEYVRVDLYLTNGNIYFGEMTFTPDTALNEAYKSYQPAMKYQLDCIVENRKAMKKPL